MSESELVVDVAGLSVGYGSRTVLRDVDLAVSANEAVAILGPNGSGKSTLVRTALGLVPPASGSVRLFGRPVRTFRQWYRVGYVPQRLGAAGGVPATVAEVVAAGRLARRRIPFPARLRDRAVADRALEAVGLSERAGDAVATLSGGQQQRVLIARALATEPDLLVMDEPTAGVDAANQRLFADILRDHLDDGGAVVLVAHELGPVAEIIDRAVVLSQGRVVHDGPVPDIDDTAGHHRHGETGRDMWRMA